MDIDGGGDYLTIQEGIDAAAFGDTVLVYPGRYNEWLTMGADQDGVVLASRDGADSTTVHGLGVFASPLLLIEDAGPSTRVCGFTFENNRVNGHGAAVRGLSSSFTLEDCIIQACDADGAGGGVHLYYPDGVVVRGCVIRDCWSREGGGLDTSGGSAVVEDTEFHDNWVTAFNGVDGGAVAVWGDILVRRCLFERNDSMPSSGNAIYASGPSVVSVEECGFHDQQGPAINFHGASLTITGSIFTENGYPTFPGCVIRVSSTSAEDIAVTDNVFFANRDPVLHVYAGAPPLFSGNSVDPNGHHVIDIGEGANAGTLNATGNWWGTIDSEEIADLIWDCTDTLSVDMCVDFSDWCVDTSCAGHVTGVGEAQRESWGRIKSKYR